MAHLSYISLPFVHRSISGFFWYLWYIWHIPLLKILISVALEYSLVSVRSSLTIILFQNIVGIITTFFFPSDENGNFSRSPPRCCLGILFGIAKNLYIILRNVNSFFYSKSFRLETWYVSAFSSCFMSFSKIAKLFSHKCSAFLA